MSSCVRRGRLDWEGAESLGLVGLQHLLSSQMTEASLPRIPSLL